MADETPPQLQEARLGTAAPGSVFSFFVEPGPGFEVNANLTCDMQLVAIWQSIEILTGKPVKETIVPPGIYVLHLSIVYRGKTAVDVNTRFTLKGAETVSEALAFRGKSRDMGQAL